MNRRKWQRKRLDPIHVSDITGVTQSVSFARYGTILNASASGMLIAIRDCDLNPDRCCPQASVESIKGEQVRMSIVEMNLAIDARVVRIHRTKPEGFEMAVDFTENAPQYWRECLAELLPGLGEISRGDGDARHSKRGNGLDAAADC